MAVSVHDVTPSTSGNSHTTSVDATCMNGLWWRTRINGKINESYEKTPPNPPGASGRAVSYQPDHGLSWSHISMHRHSV
jgi:hypothetical protein